MAVNLTPFKFLDSKYDAMWKSWIKIWPALKIVIQKLSFFQFFLKFSSKLLFLKQFQLITWHVLEFLFQSSTRCEVFAQILTRLHILFQNLTRCKKTDPKSECSQKYCSKTVFFSKKIFLRILLLKKYGNASVDYFMEKSSAKTNFLEAFSVKIFIS